MKLSFVMVLLWRKPLFWGGFLPATSWSFFTNHLKPLVFCFFFSSPINTGFLSILFICTSSLFLTSLSHFEKQYAPIICKISILEYWQFSRATRIWSNNSNITLTCWRITNFNFFVDCSYLCFDLFLPRF